MYRIVGVKEEFHYKGFGEKSTTSESEEIIATFDLKKDAEEYIEKSKLKKIIHKNFCSDRVFCRSSLLSDCQDAYVESHYEESLPHNPEVPVDRRFGRSS